MADWGQFAIEHAPAILDGTLMTLKLTMCGGIGGIVLGIALAAVVRHWPHISRRAIHLYVEIFRDTPFVVQLFFIFFGLPSLGIHLDSFVAAVVAITLNLGAYATEIIRAGLDAVAPGQEETARALGLPRWVIFIRVLLPQALASVFPALASQVVLSMLDTALVSQIALRDLTFEADLIQSRNFLPFETYAVVTFIYLLLSILVRRALGLCSQPLRRRLA